MITKRISDLMLVGLCFHQLLHSNAQYTEKPSGVAGIVQSIISTSTDLIENSFESAVESTDMIDRLLKNVLHRLFNNPTTQLTPGLRNRNVGTSMIMLRNSYLESLELVVETIHQRTERLAEVREQIKRVESIMEVPTRELQYTVRCLNTQMATDIANELYTCAIPTIHSTLDEMKQIHEEVEKVLSQLQNFLQRRFMCLKRPPRESVSCFQNLIEETPAFLESLHNTFNIPKSMYELMQIANECSSRLRNLIKALCSEHLRTVEQP